MEKYNGSLIRQFDSESTGNAGASVSVTVRTLPSLGLATIYSANDTGSNPLSNPLQTDSRGRYSFYAANGRYQLDFGTGEDSIEILLQDGIDEQAVQDIIDQLETEALSRSKVSSPVTLTSSQTTVSFEGFNASLSSYYISSVGGDVPSYRLFEGQHYTVEDEVTEEITLLETYPAGTNLYAASLDPTGTGVVATPSQFETVAEMQAATLIPVGSIVEVVENGSARYKISASGTTVNIGDKTLNNGQVAVLQPLQDGSWDVRAFGAVDDQSDVLGSQLSYFSLAAQRALLSSCVVTIPVMKVRLSGTALTHDVIWNISSKTVFTNLAGVSPTFVYNMSILGGKINVTRSGVGVGFKYFGDPKYTYQSKTNRTMTTGVINASSTNGAVSVLGATCTSLNTSTTPDQSGIGVTAKVLNDNTTTGHSAWGGYDEAIRYDGNVTGNTYGRETSFSNGGTTCKILKPYDDLNVGETSIVGHAVSCGLNNYTGPVTAFSYWSRTAASTRAYKGLVVLDETIATGAYLAEVIAMPNNHGLSWYDETNVIGAYVKYVNDDDGNSVRTGVFKSDFSELRTFNVGFSSIKMGNSNVDLGEVTARYKSLYLLNSPDVVSDADKKTSKRDISDKEISAGLELARNVQMFKWISEVVEKGESDAYYHTSVMAQEAWQILIDNELDPTDYGFISNQEGNWSVMPTELSMLMCAALVKNQDLLEQRIASLENV